jgi:hypothetical protein
LKSQEIIGMHHQARLYLDFFFASSTGVWTQGFTLGRQALYQLNHGSRSFSFFWLFLRQCLALFSLGQPGPWSYYEIFHVVAGMTGLHNHVQPFSLKMGVLLTFLPRPAILSLPYRWDDTKIHIQNRSVIVTTAILFMWLNMLPGLFDDTILAWTNVFWPKKPRNKLEYKVQVRFSPNFTELIQVYVLAFWTFYNIVGILIWTINIGL